MAKKAQHQKNPNGNGDRTSDLGFEQTMPTSPDNKYLRYFLDRNLPARIRLEKKDGNTPYIVLGTITDMPLLIPRDEDEQQSIANCLSSLDDLIAARSDKLEALKTHKRGLMQQIFPSPTEAEA